jgi:hypothetical protein
MKTKHVPHSAKMDFSEWNLDSFDAVKDFFSLALNEIAELAARDKVQAYFPIEWGDSFEYEGTVKPGEDGIGGKTPDDPLTVYVLLPIGPDEDNSPAWSFVLSDLLKSSIDLHINQDGKIDEESKELFLKMRDGFSDLIKIIDEAIEA